MVMDKCTMEIPPADYEWKDTQMDPMAIMPAAGQKTVALADEAARNLGCTSAKAFLQVQQEKYVAGAIGVGALAWLLLKHKQ